MKFMLMAFLMRVLCIMSSYIRANSESTQNAEISMRKCQEKITSVLDKQLLVPPSWQCTSSCIATDSWLFGQHAHNCASSATLLIWPVSGRLFLFPQLKSILERWFQMIQGIT
jgi:hypothetical protein